MGQEAVDAAFAALAVAVDARHGLQVGAGVPVDVEEDEPAGADEVQACAAGFGGQQEGEARAGGGAVEFVDEGLAFGGGGGAVEAEEWVGEGGEQDAD